VHDLPSNKNTEKHGLACGKWHNFYARARIQHMLVKSIKLVANSHRRLARNVQLVHLEMPAFGGTHALINKPHSLNSLRG